LICISDKAKYFLFRRLTQIRRCGASGKSANQRRFNRHCEERELRSNPFLAWGDGLLRFARNDERTKRRPILAELDTGGAVREQTEPDAVVPESPAHRERRIAAALNHSAALQTHRKVLKIRIDE
jgi:hypothetical protein